MTDLLAPSLADKLHELERELNMRHSAYPKWIAAKRMSQRMADRQRYVLEAILEDYRTMAVETPRDTP